MFGGDRFLIFSHQSVSQTSEICSSKFQRSSSIRSGRKRRRKNDRYDPPGGAVRLSYLRRNRHTCQQTTRESRVAVTHVVTLYVVVQSWLIDKQAKKMQPVQALVGEGVITWPGAGRCRRTIADVDEPSKKCRLFIFGVPCIVLRLPSNDKGWDSQSRRRSFYSRSSKKQPFSQHGPSRPRKSQNSFD